MLIADAAWAALKALPWKWIGLAVALIAIYFAIDGRGYSRGRHSRDDEVAALAKTIANLRDASAQALAQNHADVQRITALQDQITKDTANDYPGQLADARTALAAYVRLHPATKADSGRPGQDRASAVPDAAGRADAAPSQAVVSVPDLDACAQAYVTAAGLQDWIRREAAIDR